MSEIYSSVEDEATMLQPFNEWLEEFSLFDNYFSQLHSLVEGVTSVSQSGEERQRRRPLRDLGRNIVPITEK